jgi:hypothetical protein
MSPWEIQLQIKYSQIEMYFILLCVWESWVHAMVPWLSQKIIVADSWGYPSSAKRLWNQRTSWAQCVTAIYSASYKDNTTTACCFELQAIGDWPNKIIKLKTDLRLSPIPQSESNIVTLRLTTHVIRYSFSSYSYLVYTYTLSHLRSFLIYLGPIHCCED